MPTRHDHDGTQTEPNRLWQSPVQATLHCLTGCAIGEGARHGARDRVRLGRRRFDRGLCRFRRAVGVPFASDTVSITTMEIVDNVFIQIVPGAMGRRPRRWPLWWSLALSLVIAFVLTVPANRWLISRGRGHAVMHELHAH